MCHALMRYLLQVKQELWDMSVRAHEGLRFPDEAIKYEVDAYVAAASNGTPHTICLFLRTINALSTSMRHEQLSTPCVP